MTFTNKILISNENLNYSIELSNAEDRQILEYMWWPSIFETSAWLLVRVIAFKKQK
jgi:hypothetical protein